MKNHDPLTFFDRVFGVCVVLVVAGLMMGLLIETSARAYSRVREVNCAHAK